MNKQKFLAGVPFRVLRNQWQAFKRVDNNAGGRIEATDFPIREGAIRDVWEYSCNIDKVTDQGVHVYVSLMGRSVSRFQRFSEMVEIEIEKKV